MPRIRFAILATVALCVATPLTAQETTAETPTEDNTPGSDLPLGVPAGPQPGQLYLKESHGDFQVRCVVAGEGQADICQLFQRMSDQNGNPTADINFFDVAGGGQVAGGATVVTPLLTLLPTAIRLSVDGGTERIYPFSHCDQQGCYSRMGFTAEEMAQFRAGAKGNIKVRSIAAPDDDVILDLSLAGFTAGIQAVTPNAQ